MLPAMILMAIYVLVLAAFSSAMSSIFSVALYRYAIYKQESGGFTQDQFAAAWVPKN
jgi:hypothetical protein